LEEAVHDSVPVLGVELLGELHRAFHVSEEDGYLLALAFEGRARGENLLGEVLRGVGTRVARRRRGSCGGLTTLETELGTCRELGAAGRAGGSQTRPALRAELRRGWAIVLTARASHGAFRCADAPGRFACSALTARGSNDHRAQHCHVQTAEKPARRRGTKGSGAHPPSPLEARITGRDAVAHLGTVQGAGSAGGH